MSRDGGSVCGCTGAEQAPLWQADPSGPRRFPLADYVKLRMPGFFDLLIGDEVHEYKGRGSAQGIAAGILADACGKSLSLSRRTWRIGQTEPVKVVFMAYRSTLRADALKLLAQKLQRSLAVKGELPEDGFAAYGDDGGDLMLALARKLVSGEEDTDSVKSVFERAQRLAADAVLPIVAELIEAAGGVEQIGPLKLVVSTEVSAYFADLGGLIAGMIERVTGLSVEFEQLDGAAAISRLSNGERFAYVAWGELPVSPLPIGAWSRSLHSQGAESWGAFPDAELDRLLEQLHRELNFDVLTELIAEIQRRLLSGASTGWIQNLANPVQLSIVQPWFSPDARLLDYGWSDHHLADCGIRLRSGSGYPADRRPLSGFEEAKETPQVSR